VDVVFECAGQQETIDQAVELLKPGGKLMLVGIPRLERISFIIDKIRRKEITIVNVRRQNNCTQMAIDLIATGKVKVDFMITHRFKLEQTQQAFDMVAEYRDGVIKALIEL
jgi:threonine dehydrogenase-like Zn-dependent dehydrogenase